MLPIGLAKSGRGYGRNTSFRQFTVTILLLGDEFEMCKRGFRFNETEGGDPMSSEIKLKVKLWFVEGLLEQPPQFG